MMKTTLSRANCHSFALRKVKSIEKAAGKEISAVKGRSVGMGEFFRLWKKVLIGNG